MKQEKESTEKFNVEDVVLRARSLTMQQEHNTVKEKWLLLDF